MQTFLPYPSFTDSAQCLDRQRLGKQRVEAFQILKTLLYGGGWKHHPAVRMWAGSEQCLVHYGIVICEEWRRRGYADTMIHRFRDLAQNEVLTWPWWLGDARLHTSHRANLLRKLSEWYGAFGWTEKPAIGYWWPERS